MLEFTLNNKLYGFLYLIGGTIVNQHKIKRIKVVCLCIILFMLSIPGAAVQAGNSITQADKIQFYAQNQKFWLEEPGDYWYEINVDKLSDIYFEVDTNLAYEGTYTKLFHKDLSALIADDTTRNTSEFFMAKKWAAAGKYYLKVHTEVSQIEINITAEQFTSTDDKNEPNNWMYFATPLKFDASSLVKDGNLGNDFGNDVDFYSYYALEPCMVTVGLQDIKSQVDMSIYVGNTVIASTSKWEHPLEIITGNNYAFNHTHGIFYIKIFGGDGAYTLDIVKGDYQTEIVAYSKNPVSKQLISEFDILTPKISILGNGQVTTSYDLMIKYNSYTGEKKSLTANCNAFTEQEFAPIHPSQITGSNYGNFHRITYHTDYVKGTKNKQTDVVHLLYDEAAPNGNTKITVNEDSIEVSIISPKDEYGLADRPFRYRIYPAGTTPPSYCDWNTSCYYSKGIEGDEKLVTGIEYVVEAQIRDKVAEKFQNSTQDLSKHIRTITKSAQLN